MDQVPLLPVTKQVGDEHRTYENYYVFTWNRIALDLNRLSHSLSGPQNGPPLSARALGIFHLAIHDAYFGLDPQPKWQAYLTPATHPPLPQAPPVTAGSKSKQQEESVAGAAYTVLNKLYRSPAKREGNVSNNTLLVLGKFLDKEVRTCVRTSGVDRLSQSFLFGVKVARAILQLLEVKVDEPGTDTGAYVPKFPDPYYFGDDPSNPIRLRAFDPNNPSAGDQAQRPYHAPYYGDTARRFAVQKDHQNHPPPVRPADPAHTDVNKAEYDDAFRDVVRMGGLISLPTTKRREDQTVKGLFWAYDGTTLIGTPPRLYNQMVRQIAYDKLQRSDVGCESNTADLVRLFALVNVAMADAGIYCWREKYRYELWRPLPGVRNDPHHPMPTWRVFGAPETNSNRQPFKPPFPAYPSGHATFGAACFHMVQMFYDDRDKDSANHSKQVFKQHSPGGPQGKSTSDDTGPSAKPNDNAKSANNKISFEFISDEMNNISRDLYQPWVPTRPIEDQDGDVRTLVVNKFDSLWHAIWENALSRVWLGVHWRYDAFDADNMVFKKDTKVTTQEGCEKIVAVSELEDDMSTKYRPVYGTAAQFYNSSKEVIGGVPLGLEIAEDIYKNNLSFPPATIQP